MAASHTRAGSRVSLGQGEQDLPNGSCNYRDLSTGSSAPVCGCTRFWLNVCHFNANDGGVERAWCFCGHHACFHNAFSQQQEERGQTIAGSRMGNTQAVSERNGSDAVGGAQGFVTPAKPLAGLGIRPDSRQQTESINTRVFQALNEFARNQEDGEQAMSDATSKLPSTNAPSLVEEPWNGYEPVAHQASQQYRPMAPPVNIPPGPHARQNEEYSATEVDTPSIAGTPDFRALMSCSSIRPSPGHLRPGRLEFPRPRPRTEPPHTTDATTSRPFRPERPHPVATTVPDLQNIIETYGRRLNVLESLSFSHVPVEEIQDRFEHFDGRILDLEQWRADRDQNQLSPDPAASSSSKRRRMLPHETSSFDSDGSFDLNAAAHTEAAVLATLAANAETHPRIDALEGRVQQLETAALPSFARPWHVQVVLLPWGRDLKGIWFSAAEATQRSMKASTQLSEEWTGAQSAPKLSFKSTKSGAWTTESIEAWANEASEWLSPKACGPSGDVFQRLASRGLVREVTLGEPDARHINNAIRDALGELAISTSETNFGGEELKGFQGLKESFIPLRKVRKSARLRFLSPAELVTSASWTASFLDSSVFMKVGDGQRRLYVTTPDAYIQPNTADSWTWRRLREMPVFEASIEEQAARAENIAIEACWSFNERLDRAVSLHSSFASHESQWSTRSLFAADDADMPNDRASSPQSELRPHRQRTASLPESSEAAGEAKAALPKRRVASFEPVATCADEHGVETTAKRRRISISPEAERRGVNFTPRWSREPPSPFTSEAPIEARSQGASSSRKRGTTPFAYATPHSNNNFVGRVELGSGDGDTEVATDIMDRGGEEEWEGVDDGATNPSDDASVAQEGDIDDNELEIYED
ncbi:uncharacterized protein LTR77_006198 [Saxophila tyrrhenica]|uniref:Uncharacterized protein n=1 Tax=Saxophila tyrrhenica TaxID=1690608 RepID=A0AAV9PA93_9PEZI|nr:hypothetical protein LTR77_006198 [Saxophila tyrrhenica]